MTGLGPLIATVTLALAPGAAAATNYPPPSHPGPLAGPPAGPHRTLSVCGRGGGRDCFARIQDAVDAARAGDTVQVPAGRWRESVTVRGSARRYVRLIGDPEKPGRVILEGAGRRGVGVWVRGADHVTVRGFAARGFRTAGFAVSGADGVSLRDVVATGSGAFGVRVTRSTGGVIADAHASGAARAGFAIAATPEQTRPRRTIVRRVGASGNAVGLAGDGMRHVTVTGSSFHRNNRGAGVPFAGSGIVLRGGAGNVVAGNRVFGNRLVGVLLTGEPAGTRVEDNAFAGGSPRDALNARDLAYAGGGSGNCFGAHAFRSPTVPADGATFAACPFSGANPAREDAHAEIAGWAAG